MQKLWIWLKVVLLIPKKKASKCLGISRRVIDYFLDTRKPEGVKGRYLYTRPLTNSEIKTLNLVSENL